MIMIKVYDRTTKSYKEELVAGKRYLEWIYESSTGRNITELIIKKNYLLNYMVCFVILN